MKIDIDNDIIELLKAVYDGELGKAGIIVAIEDTLVAYCEERRRAGFGDPDKAEKLINKYYDKAKVRYLR